MNFYIPLLDNYEINIFRRICIYNLYEGYVCFELHIFLTFLEV